jgi:hypothetical protein
VVTFCVVHCMCFNKQMMICIHHYSIQQICFIALTMPCFPPIFSFVLSNQVWQCHFYTVFIISFFPKCHIAGIRTLSFSQIGFIHLALCCEISPMTFCGLTAYFLKFPFRFSYKHVFINSSVGFIVIVT